MSPHDLGFTRAAYSRKEAAKLLSIGLSLLDQMIADGRLRSAKLGKGPNARRVILATSMAEVLSGGAQPTEARA
jgi:excisionase family DNA binding protein